MKKIIILAAALGSPVLWAQASLQKVEVNLSGVYLPRVGFDDNDAIEAVLDGELPNLCYTLTEPKVDIDLENHKINVTQYASRRTDGMCAQGESLPEEALATNPFQQTMMIGHLPDGSYSINYATEAGPRTRRFEVGMAPVASVDNVRYATVTNATVPDVTSSLKPTTIELQGLLPTPCHQLVGVATQAVDDVMVVLPTIRAISNGPCLQVIRPFSTKVNIGVLSAGRHLVHVRSANGRSVNRLLSTERCRQGDNCN